MTAPARIGRPPGTPNAHRRIETPAEFSTNPDRACNPDRIDRAVSRYFTSDNRWQTAEAKRICHGCPVRIPCLRYALQRDERHHVWGGVTMSSGAEKARGHRELAEAETREQELLGDLDHYGAEVAWLTSRGRTDQHIAVLLRTTVDTVHAIRERLEQAIAA